MSGIIQGLEKAISRFEKKGTNFFALYCGNDKFPLVNGLNGRYEEISDCVEELKEYFDDITPDHKKTYSIVYYDNIVKPDAKGKIQELPAGAVKFVTSNPEQIQEYYNGYAQRQQNYVSNNNNAILSKLEAIEKKIAEDDENVEEINEPQGFAGMISGLVNNPDVQAMIANIFIGALDRFMPLKKETVAINGFDDNKLDEALMILKKHDPELESDLMLLAKMAESNPGQFKFLLSMLRK
jgi:hypothetical protein